MASAAVAVAAWIGSSIGAAAGSVAAAVGVSAATAATVTAAVTAVATNVVIGAAVGAVIGGATAAITGGNILDGALKGAAIGGVTAGVVSGLSMATGYASSAEQMAGLGLSDTGAALPEVATSPGALVQGGTGNIDIPSTVTADTLNGGTGALKDVAPNIASNAGEETAKKGILSRISDSALSDEGIGGILEGGGKALGQVAAAKLESENTMELAEYEAQQEALDQSQEDDFTARTAKIEVPEWWNKYSNIEVTV